MLALRALSAPSHKNTYHHVRYSIVRRACRGSTRAPFGADDLPRADGFLRLQPRLRSRPRQTSGPARGFGRFVRQQQRVQTHVDRSDHAATGIQKPVHQPNHRPRSGAGGNHPRPRRQRPRSGSDSSSGSGLPGSDARSGRDVRSDGTVPVQRPGRLFRARRVLEVELATYARKDYGIKRAA